jgi:hypothetical protein
LTQKKPALKKIIFGVNLFSEKLNRNKGYAAGRVQRMTDQDGSPVSAWGAGFRRIPRSSTLPGNSQYLA